MPLGEALITAPAAPPPSGGGVRVVTRNNGQYVDLMPSPSSSYLLPELANSSLVRREACSGAGALRFAPAGGVVEVFDDIDGFHGLDSLLSGLNLQIIGAGAVGASTAMGLDAFSSLFAAGVLDLAKLQMPTTTGWFLASAGVYATDKLITPATVDVLEDKVLPEPLTPDASVSAIATRIGQLSGLSDDQLADLFKVHRETYCRWRLGSLSNPRVGNRRRLRLLLLLLEDLNQREVSIKDWLLNSAVADGLTPYELLDCGRIDDVAFAATMLGDPRAITRDPRIVTGTDEEPLEFGDDDVWNLEPPFEEDE